MVKRQAEVNTAQADGVQPLNVKSLIWGGLTWVNIEQPTERETEYLAQNYPFHPLDLDDCLSRTQRPKIDEYQSYLFLVFHFPTYNKEARVTTTSQLSVFIGKNYLITLHKGELKPLVKLFKECQLDEDSRQEHFNQGSGYLLYRIVDRLIDYCLPIVNRIGRNIETVEDDIFSNEMPRAIKDISELRRDVISFRRIIWPMRAIAASLEPKIRRFTKMDLSVYLGDMVDHVDKIWDALDEYKEIIEGLNDTHDSLATNRTNEVVRMLTVIATILLPITVVASIFGMNIQLGDYFKNSPYAFIFVFIICLAIIVGMLFFFRRQHWI
ncbi:magnesium/cobalt transporter CorA [Chloroflexota bacterium]